MSLSACFTKAIVVGIALSLPVPAFSADWTKPDIDKALAIVDKGKSDIIGCLKDFKTTISYDVAQLDLNKDGVNELVVTSGPADFGDGPSAGAHIACFGDFGIADLMISDGKGGWIDNIGFNVHSLQYSDRLDSLWPDVELVGKTSCNPIYRYDKDQYSIWKQCDDDGNHIYADAKANTAAPAVPQLGNNSGPVEFTHNGSTMLVDPARGTISYKIPKHSISKTVHEGDVVFQGRPWNSSDPDSKIEGTAFTFKKGCAPAPYHVSGYLTFAGQAITLEGAAPVRDKRSCGIKGYSATSGSSHLEPPQRNQDLDRAATLSAATGYLETIQLKHPTKFQSRVHIRAASQNLSLLF